MTESGTGRSTTPLRSPAEPLAALRDTAGTTQFDFRACTRRGRCNHDLPCVADHRRGRAGEQGRRRMAIGYFARSNHPGSCQRLAAISTPRVDKAVSVARAFTGVVEVRPYSKEESAKLLEPWLGSGLSLNELPVPRLIVVKIAADATPDLAQLRRVLADQVPGATLDDHRGWIDRMRAMAGTAVAAGICILILMFAATILSVTFATRGAMATNKAVIEVLHFVGAKNGFIAGHFQHHFLDTRSAGGRHWRWCRDYPVCDR